MEAIWVTCVVIAIAGWLYIYVLRDPILDVYDTIAPILRFHIARWRGESVKHFAASPADEQRITSSIVGGTEGAVPVPHEVVPSDTYQVVPAVPPAQTSGEKSSALPMLESLSDEELFTTMALLRRGGEYVWSANALATAFGGKRNDQLERVAKLRAGLVTSSSPDHPVTAPISGRRLPSGVQFASDMIEEASKA
jgi:hypothetical protein